MRSLRSLLALAGATALAVTACTPVQTPAPSPSVTEEVETTPPPVEELTPPNWPEIARTSAAGIDGLDTVAFVDNDAQARAVVPQLAGHEQFNARLAQWAEVLVEDFVKDFGPTEEDTAEGAGDDQVAAAWLSATWDATAISQTVLGIVLDSSMSPGASTMLAQQVLWYNPDAGKILDWRDFLTDDARAALPDAIVAGLKAASDSIKGGDIDVEALTVLLDDDDLSVGFSDSGGLVITFDDYSILAGSYGSPAVEFSGEQTAGWLTSEGKLAQAATVDPDVAAVPNAPAAPEAPEVDCEAVACVAITFDDGPSPSTTPQLLKILEDEGVVATFFMIGSQAQAFPQVVADVAGAGHEVASHTWSHPSLPKIGEAAAREELRRTNAVLSEVTGVDVTLMRPPYGATDATVAAVAKGEGVAQILWNIDTRDWDHHDPAKTIAESAKAQPGSIILMHDIHETTIDAVPGVIKALREKGYTFVTVSTLLGETAPGKQYRSR